MTFTLIAEFNSPVAILCDAAPNPGQRSILFGLLPDPAYDSPDLADRWAIPTVLCTPDWQCQQLARRPMLKPKGPRLAFLTVLAFAICNVQCAIPNLQSAESADNLMPSLVVVAPPPVTFYFAGSAYNYMDGAKLSSDLCPEISWRRTNHERAVELAWDPEDCDGYDLWWSRTSGQLTNTVDAGCETNLTIQIVPPPKTNTVITVTGAALQGASGVTIGQWVDLHTSRWCHTNPPTGMIFRSATTNPASIAIFRY